MTAAVGVLTPGAALRLYYPQGIDVYYENIIDVTQYPGDFVIHKCTHGSLYHDPAYEGRRLSWKKLWGSYHFCTTDDAVAQVDNYLSHIGVGLLAIDCEPNKADPNLTLVDCALVAAEIHKRTGIWPLLYSSATAIGALYMDAIRVQGVVKANAALLLLRNCPLWRAGTEQPAQWTVWTLYQYTTNRVTGASAVIDEDRANFNSIADLTAWWQRMSCGGAEKGIPGMKNSNGNIYWPYASGIYKMNLPPQPTPEQMWESETQAEALRSSLPPYTLGILSLLDPSGTPHDFAVFAGHWLGKPGDEPAPTPPALITMQVVPTAGIFIHADPLPGQTHLDSAHAGSLPFNAQVTVIPGTEVAETTVQGITHTWIKRVAGGWVAKDLLKLV